jgi:hypothetical protein
MSAKKRVSLVGAMKAARDKVEPSASSKPVAGEANDYQTTAINIRRDQWVLLGDVANARRKSRGGRQSVSDIIRDLIEASRKSLEAEIAK